MVSGPDTSWQIEGGRVEAFRDDFLLLGSKISADGDCIHEIRRRLLLGRKAMTNLNHVLRSKNTTLMTKVCIIKALYVWMCKLDHKEGRVPKNWCFRTVVLENTLERLLGCKEIKPVNSKGNQPWILIRRTDAEVEVTILWPSVANSWHWNWEGLRMKGEEGDREWDGWMASSIQWIWTWENSQMVRDREAWHAVVHEVTKSWTWLGC